GDAVLQHLVADGADVDRVGGVAGQDDRAGPDRRTALDHQSTVDPGRGAAGLGQLLGGQEQLEDAAAVGAGDERVGDLVQLQVLDLHPRHVHAEAVPGGAAVDGLVHAIVVARVQEAVTCVHGQRPGGQVG